MAHLADLFSVPEMSLLCNITEFFLQNNIEYHPEILFRDVKVRLTFTTFWDHLSLMVFIKGFSACYSSSNAPDHSPRKRRRLLRIRSEVADIFRPFDQCWEKAFSCYEFTFYFCVSYHSMSPETSKLSRLNICSDKGMKYLLGNDWRDVFDVIIVQARKPKFFTDRSRPFRIYDLNQSAHVWDKVSRLEKGQVYYEVTTVFNNCIKI